MDFKTVINHLNSKKDEEIVEGLRSITNECNQLRKDKVDVSTQRTLLSQYLDSSPHCIELFNIWNDARGNYDQILLQALFETLAECIRYGNDNLKKELCLTILRKQTADVMGALSSENRYSNNSVCILLRAICDVGAAGVQLINQKIPLNTVTNFSELLSNTRTRYRSARWVAGILRNDPDLVGKQLLLRQDVIAALADNLHRDGEILMKDLVDLFSMSILNSSYCSTKLKQSFFSSATLINYITVCQKDTCPVFFKQFVLSLFGDSACVLFPRLSQFTSTTFLPSTLFKIALALNPFKHAFDRTLYLLIVKEHPEIIPALFNEPTKQISSVDSYVNVNALEQSKAKVLINWMLEPRDSTLWEKTIDFLVEVLHLPLALPKDLITLASTNPSMFLTSIHSWMYPGVLTRSILSKGLATTNSMMILKTLELIEAISTRMRRIAFAVYSSLEQATVFLNHYYPILPLEDSFSQLFKKCCTCLLQNLPFSGKVVEKPKEDTSAPLINMVTNEMEVEEEEEVDVNAETYQLLYQLTMAVNSLFSLFAKEMGQFRIDLIPLFSLMNQQPLLFTLEENSLIAMLQLLSKIVRSNPSFSSQFIAGKNEIKPMLPLIQFYPTASAAVQKELCDLLFILFEQSQAFAGFVQPLSTLHLLLSLLTPSLAQYLFDVIVDLRAQRIRFLTRNNQFQLQTPLLFHACLYSALKPKAVNTIVNLFLCMKVLLLTQPQCIQSILNLAKKYIDEALLDEEGKSRLGSDKLLAGQMTDDMLQMLRLVVQEWSGCYEPMKLKITVELDFGSLDKEYEENIDACLMTVFHTFLWHTVKKEDLQKLAQRERLVPLLLLSTQQMEDSSIKEAHAVVVNAMPSLTEVCAVLVDMSQIALNGTLPSEPASLQYVPSMLYLFFYQSIINQDCSQLDGLKQFVQVASMQDIEMVLDNFCSTLPQLFLQEAYLEYMLTLFARMAALKESGNERIQRKVIDLLLRENASNGGYYLTYLASALYTEERLKLIQSILTSPSIQFTALQPFTLPLDQTLIQELIAASMKEQSTEYCIQLLLINLVHSHEEALKQLLTAEHLSTYIKQLRNPLIKQFIQFLMKGYPSIHARFWSVCFSPMHDGELYEHFDFFSDLMVRSLSHPGIHNTPDETAIVQTIQGSTFFTDLVNKLSSTQLSVYLECFQLLTKYPEFSSSVQIDLVSICKQSFKKEAISKQRFYSLFLLCKQDQNEKAIGTLVLRSIQELAKRWGKSGDNTEEIEEFVDALTDLLVDEPSILVLLLKKQNELLMKFCRLLLRERLEDWRSVKLLRILIEASYASNLMIENVNNINILELVTTHSSYPTILNRIREECVCSSDDELRKKWLNYAPSHYQYSVEFFRFVRVMVQYNPFYCSQAFFFQLLSFYNCSFSPSDIILRSIFRHLHKSNRFSLEDVGYLFGRFAPATASENIQTPSTWLLEAVSGLRLRKSIEDFPRKKEAEMEIEESEEEEEREEEDIVNDAEDEDEEKRMGLEGYTGYEDEELEVEDTPVENVFDVNMDCIEKLLSEDMELEVHGHDCILIVDPSVYLPLVYYYLNLSSVDTRAYISHGVAGYILACMSSSNPVIRQCASCILQRFYEIILDSSFFEQKQIALAFRKLQNSIVTPSTQLSSIIVSFFNESLGILLRPGNPLYNYISRFFLSFPTFNLMDTPLFHQLFMNENEDYKQLRAWCLRFLLRGTQTYQDYMILNRRHVVSQVQAFTLSSNSDLYTQKCCMGIIYRLASIPAVVPMLYNSVGLFPWLMMVLKSAKSRVIVYCVVDILSRMLEAIPNGNEMMVIQSLLMMKQLLEMMSESAEEELADFNKLLLSSVKCYKVLTARMEGTGSSSLHQLFFTVWKLLLAGMRRFKGRTTPANSSLLITDCVLSNDDFFLLCNPQLVSFEDGYKEACTLLKEIHSVLPFSSSMLSEVEGDYDHLFL